MEVLAVMALQTAADSPSQKSSKFIIGVGADSGDLPVAFDCVAKERVYFNVLVGVWQTEVSSSSASYFSNSFFLAVLSWNPLLLPPSEYSVIRDWR
jgi:hypothetical protein